ncbi:MAG: NAD-dependent dihydropyrimidine dehydrogenase subunit PreA [Clostridia bacterium]|nr:NAD-dependent dihydropyrimidine dehydrogenase subunit PreA [Clostridia bacterium]NCC44975.1 NAD-dependent dihydropyrimidine dehydrogenase subunit PreA [Clostridia bacterium]
MTSTLHTNFVGVDMPSPFMLASAPPSASPQSVARAFEMGWGGAMMKTIQYTPRFIKQNVNPRINAVKWGKQIVGFTNFEIGSQKTIEQWADSIRWLKERYPEHGVFVSLMHTDVLVEEEWKELTRIFDQAGADGFELNLSCSHGQAESGCGAVLGADPEMIKMVVGWVKSQTNKPVVPKLTALTVDLPTRGRAAKEAGASAISAINTISSLPGIDLDTFRPVNAVDGMSAFQGSSGRMLKPIALRSVAQLAAATDLPISATGGCYSWKDAAEFIAAGAQTVQVCSAIMEYGYGIIEKLNSGLLQYMEEKGFETIEDFRGKTLPYITQQIKLSRDYRLYASVDETTCVGCGRCVPSCADNGFGAMKIVDGKAVNDKNICDGCGLCSQICPTGSIQMKRK